jgi:hypothetical protein
MVVDCYACPSRYCACRLALTLRATNRSDRGCHEIAEWTRSTPSRSVGGARSGYHINVSAHPGAYQLPSLNRNLRPHILGAFRVLVKFDTSSQRGISFQGDEITQQSKMCSTPRVGLACPTHHASCALGIRFDAYASALKTDDAYGVRVRPCETG